MKKKAAKIFTAFIMTAIIVQGTVMVASAAETDSTPDNVIVIETATLTVHLWKAVLIQLLFSQELML